MKSKKSKTVFSLILLGIMVLSFVSQSHAQNSKIKKVLIHLTTNIKKEDGPPCVAFDIALANIEIGNQVAFVFDSEAAWNLKKDKSGKNDFDRYPVPDDLKKIVNEQLNDLAILKLKNFGEFLSFLNKKGVKIYINGTWNLLTGVEKNVRGKTRIPDYIIPLDLKEFVNTINKTEVYYKY